MRVALDHQTQYDYDRMVFLSPQWIRLKPAAHARASVTSYSLTLSPDNHGLHWQQDPFGNFVARVDFWGAVPMMAIRVKLILNLEPVNPFDFFVEPDAESFPFAYEDRLKKALAPYRERTGPGPHLLDWVKQIDRTRQNSVHFLTGLTRQVSQAITYRIREEAGVQTAEETVARAQGSCRDSAWLLVQLLRAVGLAARFVSGYLAQVVDDSLAPVPGSAPDSLALHAWAEVFLPGAGWIGLDPTSGLLTTEGHIPLACAPDPIGAAPVTGTTDRSEATLTHRSTLVRLP